MPHWLGRLFLDRAVFEAALTQAAREADIRLAAPIRKAILSALSERNGEAAICRDPEGRPEPDPELRDTENGAHSRFPGHALTPTGVMAIRCKQFHLPDL